MKSRILASLLLTSFLGANPGTLPAQDDSPKKPAKSAVQDAKLGSTVNVHRCDALYLGGQFKESDIETLGEQKITRVITLRTEGEVPWDEKKKVEDANIEFVEVRFRSLDSLTDDVFGKIRSLLRDKSKKTLLHCGSANRVGGVWLTYRVLDEGVDLETALKEAKEIGLRVPAIEAKALDYIRRQQKDPSPKQRKESVKPGINKKFVEKRRTSDRDRL